MYVCVCIYILVHLHVYYNQKNKQEEYCQVYYNSNVNKCLINDKFWILINDHQVVKN